MSESEPKSCFSVRNVSLPFPHPMITTNGDIIYPFTQKGFPLINGFINLEEKCVEVRDRTAIKTLQTMGYFGFGFIRQFNHYSNCDQNLQQINHKNNETLSSKEVVMNSLEDNSMKDNKQMKTRMTSKYSNGKYVLDSISVPNASIETNSSHNKSSVNSESIQTFSSLNKSDINKNADEKDLNIRSDKPLKLSFEESFFISYVFGSLNVLNSETNCYLKIEEMWDYYCLHYSEDRLKFAVNYCAYHYFRSKGWVVRNGFSFGTDFLLYREGPDFYHALYSVTIHQSIDGKTSPQFDWYYLSALIRLSKNVRKELLLCIVNIPKNFDISSPHCIQTFEIELLHFDRWNASIGFND